MDTTIKGLKYTLAFTFLLLMFYACKAPEEIIRAGKVKAMSASRIIKNVEENAFEYEELSIKRIKCQYHDKEGKTSFRANLKSLNGEKIMLSIFKLNVAVGRLYLTPDSVKYINYMDKNYFLDDYSFLSNLLNIDLDFETVQSILNNSIFSYRNDPKDRDYKNFISSVESGLYVVQSYKERKLSKIYEKGKLKKADRLLKKLDDESLILQTVWIEPETFNLVKMAIEDKFNERYAFFDFGGYTQVEGNDFPSEINLAFKSEKGDVRLNVKLDGFSTAEIKNFDFKIPQRYKKLQVN